MKRTRIWISILCALVFLTGCFALGGAAEEAADVPTEADCGELRIRIEGPDSRMPMEITYSEFTDGSFRLDGLKAGEYTITEIDPEGLLDGYSLQEDSETGITVTVKAGGEVTASLFNHYAPGEAENPEEPGTEPEEGETEETVSVSVRKEWDDTGNAAGLRPDSVTVTLSNGSTYVLNAENDWSATADGLPATVNGQPAQYTWTEQDVPGYTLVYTLTNGNHTTLVNRLWQPPQTPAGKKQPSKAAGTKWETLEDYETPLGVEIMINHVGDCYE